MEKIIWIYWHQGEEKAPEIVRYAISSWRHYNRDWQVRVLDSHSILKFMNRERFQFLREKLPYAALSDYVRINLLARYGGVWADATVFCCKPLNDWLGEYFRQSFFAFSEPAPFNGIRRPLSSWFLAGTPESYLIQSWRDDVERFLSSVVHSDLNRDEFYSFVEYFWFHNLFEERLADDNVFNDLWSSVPKFPADIPQLLVKFRFLAEPDVETVTHINQVMSPVYKLNHRKPLPENWKNLNIGCLVNKHLSV